MKLKPSLITFLSGLSILASAQAQTSTWNVVGSGSWNSAASWNPSTAIPSSTDAVVFNTSTDTTASLGANQVAASLSVSSSASATGNANRLIINGGGANRTLVVSGQTTVSGNANCAIGSTTANQNVSLTTTNIVKSGTSNLELANANTIGNILLEQGNLFGRNAGSFGTADSGTITLGAATGSASANFRLATGTFLAKPVVLGGSTGVLKIDTLGATSPVFTGGVTGTNNLWITSTNGGTMTVNTGAIAHTGTLNVSNTGNTALGVVTLNSAIGATVTDVIFTNTNTVAGSLINLNSAANAYSGNTTIADLANVRLGNSEVIPDGPGKGNVTVNGILDLRTTTADSIETINGLSGAATGIIKRSGASGSCTLIIGGNDGTGVYDGAFDQGGGEISITKIGTGEITLSSSSNGYTGDTTISGGTLTLKSQDFLPTDAVISIAAGATLNLDYTGLTSVPTLRLAGTAQSTGKWGRVGSVAALGANFETPFITGDGLLDVTNASGELYWDGSGTSWAAASSWSLDLTNPNPDPLSPPDVNFTPIFGTAGVNTPQTVNLNANQDVPGMRFVVPQPFTLVGGGSDRTLALGGGGITVTADAIAPVIGSTTAGNKVGVTVSASQTWNNLAAGDPLIAHNDVAGLGSSLTLAGTGGFNFNGLCTDIPSLTISAANGVTFNGGNTVPDTLNVASSVIFNGPVTGTGTLRKLGIGSVDFNGTDTFTGDKTIDRGTINIGGDHSAATGGWLLRGYGDTGTTFSTVATALNIESGSSVTIDAAKTVQAGNSAPSGGFLAQTISSAGTVINNGALLLGRVGTLDVTGGTWTQNGTATVATQGGGLATLKVGAGASFTYANATQLILRTSTSTNTETKLIIDGGLVTTGVNLRNDNATLTTGTSSAIILTNGGTLKLSAIVADLFTTAGAGIRFECGIGGGKINTNGFSSILNLPITGTGGLTKEGLGTFNIIGNNTYTGDTIVDAGVLSLSGPNLDDDSAVTIATGAKLDLSFTGEDTVAGLKVGPTTLAAGTYDAASHPDFISGDGKLVVVPAALPTFNSWALGLGLSGDAEADFDQDGIKDALEFVLGSDPKVNSTSGITTQDVGDDFIFTFSRDDRSETTDLTLFVEAGGTIQSWPQVFEIKDTAANSTAGVAITENADAADTITVTIPKNGAEKLFARIKVVVSGS